MKWIYNDVPHGEYMPPTPQGRAAIIAIDKVIFAVIFFFCTMLCSCGSQKSVIKERSDLHIDSMATANVIVSTDSMAHSSTNTSKVDSSSTTTKETSQSVDTTLEVTRTETVWYDTQRTDTNGNSPIAKREVRTTLRKSGKTDIHGLSNFSIIKSAQTTDTHDSVQKSALQVSTKTAEVDKKIKSQTDAQQSKSESKQTKYVAMILYGIAAIIFVGIIAYIVFMAYRARDQT